MANTVTTYSTEGLDIYFQSQRAGLDAQLPTRLADFIDSTQTSLDCAIYDLRDQTVLEALARIAQSDRRLRIAFDASTERPGDLSADPKPGGTEQALQKAGLITYATPVHEGGKHLMHDKFLVRDSQSTWTGSANFTDGGLELQDNQCLVLRSTELAASYASTFERLLQSDHHEHPPAVSAVVTLGEATITPFFAPASGEDVEQAVMTALEGAERVRIMAFLVSDPGILGVLNRFHSKNFDIRGIYDPNGMKDVMHGKQNSPAYWFMKDRRFVAAPSHAFNPGREQDFMHNKAIIVDDHLVVTGSYNFSEHAEENDENLIIIDSPSIAAAYTAYFNVLYKKYARLGAAPVD